MRARPLVLVLVAAAVAASACKPPRSPRETAEGSVTGEWTSESVAPGTAGDGGRIAWRLSLEERPAGKLSGSGTMARGSDSSPFALSGVRGESEITLYFDLPGERVKYHGGIHGVTTIAGELYLPDDTIPVTFTRE